MAKAKVQVNENNKFNENDCDLEQDMKTLGQIRDQLFDDFKNCTNIADKLAIATQINSIVHARQDSELIFLRVAGFFDRDRDDEDDYCEGCPECDAEMAKGNDEAN